MSPLNQKLEQDNLRLVCQRSVEELHQLFVAWFQGSEPRESLTTSLMECLAPDFSHVAPNGQFLQGRNILIGHLQDKFGCYKNRLFQIEIYDVRLLWHDPSGSKCLCTYEEWQSWLPDNAQQIGNPEGGEESDVNSGNNNNNGQILSTRNGRNGNNGGAAGGNGRLYQGDGDDEDEDEEDEDDEVHQFGRLSTCLLERKTTDSNPNDAMATSSYRWIHVHETWLEAESPQHERYQQSDQAQLQTSLPQHPQDDTIVTGPIEYNSHDQSQITNNGNMLRNVSSSDDNDSTSSGDDIGVAPPPGGLPPASNMHDSNVTGGTRDDGEDEDDFDEGDRHLLMLMSTQSLSRDQMARQNTARDALESSGIAFYELDGANPNERDNRNSLFQLSGKWGQYPQFFLVDTAGTTTFWGTWEYFLQSHTQGRLAQDIAAASAGGSSNNLTDAVAATPTQSDNSNDSPQPQPVPDSATPPTTTPPSPTRATDASQQFPPLAPSDSRLLVLMSTQTLSSDQTRRQDDVIRILKENKIPFETIDGSVKTNREERNHLFRISTFWGKYPQLFHRQSPPPESATAGSSSSTTTFWGRWEEFEISYKRDTLIEDLKHVRPLSADQTSHSRSSVETAVDKNATGSTRSAMPQSPLKANSQGEEEADATATYVLLLVSNQSLSGDQMTRQDLVREYLNTAEIKFQELDGSSRDNRQKRNELFKISKLWGRYPQLFVASAQAATATPDQTKNGATTKGKGTKQQQEQEPIYVFWGDWDKIDATHKQGTFAEEIKSLLPSSPSVAKKRGQDLDREKDFAVAISAATRVPGPKLQLKSAEDEFLKKAEGILQFEEDDNDGKDANSKALVVSDKDEKKQEEESMNEEKFKQIAAAVSPIPQDVSSKRHVSSKLLKHAKPLTWENSLVGLSLHGFDIGTSQGPIADETWYKEVTDALESVSQYKKAMSPRRKLNLPEMVFPTAHVALEGHGFWLSWDVLDAMEEWARAHSEIPVNSQKSNRGVQVLKSKDAKLWEKKMAAIASDSSSDASSFHYDWTYSTPFTGKMEGGEWVELDESGMRVELLTDTSVPILFFDEITLFEDDLHDNGQVQLTVKIRVMPSCAYVLARLWLRVDEVVIRVRETRLLVDFFGMEPTIFRDITWRECYWESLKEHQLPTDLRSWHFDGKETPAWQGLLRKIPEVDPPEGIMKFASLQSSNPSRHIVNKLNSSVAEALTAENSLKYLE